MKSRTNIQDILNPGLKKILQISICLMLLISVFSCGSKKEAKHIASGKGIDLSGLEQPANRVIFSDVKTVLPVEKSIQPVLDAEGVISYDPSLLNTISARFSGRIEKLYVHYNFQPVTAGERIMDVYSPEILTAQHDLLLLLQQAGTDAALLAGARQKLLFMGVTEAQIKRIELTRQPIDPLPVYSTYTGHIHDIGTGSGTGNTAMGGNMSSAQGSNASPAQVQIENLPSSQTSALSIREGMYIQNGQALFSVYNTARVWAVLNIYPKDADHIRKGNHVTITLETKPGYAMDAVIDYLEPVAGQNASAIKARVYLNNAESHALKIGTLLHARIVCNEINGVWLPRRAVVDLGSSQTVFVKKENHFVSTTIHTGFANDSLIQIISGLNTLDAVAENAQYMVDSESFTGSDNAE